MVAEELVSIKRHQLMKSGVAEEAKNEIISENEGQNNVMASKKKKKKKKKVKAV